MIIWLSVVLNRTVVAVADPDPQLRGGGGGGGRGGPPGPPLKPTTVLTVETLTSRFDQFTATTNCGLRLTVSRYTSAHIRDLRFAGGSLRLPCLFLFIPYIYFN